MKENKVFWLSHGSGCGPRLSKRQRSFISTPRIVFYPFLYFLYTGGGQYNFIDVSLYRIIPPLRILYVGMVVAKPTNNKPNTLSVGNVIRLVKSPNLGPPSIDRISISSLMWSIDQCHGLLFAINPRRRS